MNQAHNLLAEVAVQRRHYESTGDLKALRESLRLGRAAVAQLAGSGEREGSALLELAATLGVLHGAEGESAHLDEALKLLTAAVRVLPHGHADLPTVYANTAGVRLRMFAATGQRADLDAAVAAARSSVSHRPADDASLAIQYINLTGVLRTRYQMLGDPADLDESIAAGRSAAKHVRPDSPHRSMVFATLAGSLQLRFADKQAEADLDEAIDAARNGLACAPAGDSRRPSAATILANGLRQHFELTGSHDSLSEAITLNREVVDQLPEGQPEQAIHLLNLASSLILRLERFRVWADLQAAEQAIDKALEFRHAVVRSDAFRLRSLCWRARSTQLDASDDRVGAKKAADLAVETAEESLIRSDPRQHGHVARLIQLGTAEAARYQLTHEREHRERAEVAYRRALALVKDGDPQQSVILADIGRVYQLSGSFSPVDSEHLKESVDLFHQALAGSVAGSPSWAQLVANLLASLVLLHQSDSESAEPRQILSLYEQVASAPAAPPRLRVAVGQLTGTLLMAASPACKRPRFLPTRSGCFRQRPGLASIAPLRKRSSPTFPD